jgi:hypothetical protein
MITNNNRGNSNGGDPNLNIVFYLGFVISHGKFSLIQTWFSLDSNLVQNWDKTLKPIGLGHTNWRKEKEQKRKRDAVWVEVTRGNGSRKGKNASDVQVERRRARHVRPLQWSYNGWLGFVQFQMDGPD